MGSDDFIDDAVLDPDAPSTEAEQAQARSFADHVDSVLAGQTLPPAMSADQRALVDIAGMIRAGANVATLDPKRSQEIVGDALDRGSQTRPQTVPDTRAREATNESDIVPLRRRIARVTPWALAALASAAAVILMLSRPNVPHQAPPHVVLPDHFHSRSSDALVGRIARAEAGDASRRLDMIFADRLHSYRALTYRQRTTP